MPKISELNHYKNIFAKLDEKYDFSKIPSDARSLTKVSINCPEHGEFVTSIKSLMRGTRCSKCGSVKAAKNRKHPLGYYRKLLECEFGDKYDFSLISDAAKRKDSVYVICPKHGKIKVQIATLLIGKGCRKCGYEKVAKDRSKPRSYFINKFNDVHKFKYDYSKVPQKMVSNNKQKYIIICPDHGEFEQAPQHHIRGHGCPKCSKYFLNETTIKRLSTNDRENSWLYCIKMYDDNEEFIKVGITRRTLEERYKHGAGGDYSYTTLLNVNMDLLDAFYIEQRTLNNFSQYVPQREFGGHTECLDISEIEIVQQYIKDALQNEGHLTHQSDRICT